MAWLTDTLPVGVEFADGLTATFGTAAYDDVTNSVHWNNAVTPPLGGASESKPQVSRQVALVVDSIPEVITVTFNVTVSAESGDVTNVVNLTYDGDSFMADSVLEAVVPPEVTFTSNTPVMLGEVAVITPTVTGTGPFEYLWDFGDDITSTLASPTHLYEAAGPFTVTVTVTSDWGTAFYASEFVVLPPEENDFFIYLPLVWKAP